MRGAIVGGVVFLAVSGAMYVTCDNSHIDIFPCRIAEQKTSRTPWC
jgi:hypothetical protein